MIGARGVIIICMQISLIYNYTFSQLDVADRYIATNRECITIIVPSQEPVLNLIGWGEPGLGTTL